MLLAVGQAAACAGLYLSGLALLPELAGCHTTGGGNQEWVASSLEEAAAGPFCRDHEGAGFMRGVVDSVAAPTALVPWDSGGVSSRVIGFSGTEP